MTKEKKVETIVVDKKIAIVDEKKELQKLVKENKEMKEIISKQSKEMTKISKMVETLSKGSELPKDTDKSLEKRAKVILENANKINSSLEKMNGEERELFINTLVGEDKAMVESFDSRFPQARSVNGTLSVVSTDLPNSAIITNIPVRVIAQKVSEIMLSYPLVSDIVDIVQVENGIKQVFYQDYRDVDSKSGFSDVVIGDYNNGHEPIFEETQKVDTEIHKGYDILDSVLNDITLSVGLFVSLVNNFVMSIARPFAKRYYTETIAMLEEDTFYDNVIAFTGTDTKDKAKEFYEEITTLSTPSRDHLTHKPKGSALALEYAMKSETMVMVINKKYASDYKYDLSANTFQLGEINIPVKKIIILDFDKVSAYSGIASGKLKEKEILLLETGLIEIMVHYSATKTTDTPKLKSVFNRYDRIGKFRYKSKLGIAFKNKTP